MRPSHASKSFTANREFTDRRDATELFRDTFDGSQGVEDYRVLNWYGVGGEGKSALSRRLIEIADEMAAAQGKKIKIARARVNLDDTSLRRIDSALLSIRLQLARSFGTSFPCFDTAFARHFVQANPGADIRERHPELFEGENELLSAFFEGTEVAAEVAGVMLPGVAMLYQWGSRLSQRAREWFQRRGQQVLRGLDQLNPDELLEKLPTYLGADICDCLRRHPNARILIALDTYEALWRDFNTKDMVQGARADAWVRLLVQDSPGVLFAIFGRDKLRWPEVDAEWGEVLDSHRLGALTDDDADHFLQKVPIEEPAVRARIVQGAKGLPFYLDLQVDLYERLAQEGVPGREHFGGSHPQILHRFLEHLTPNELATVRLASYPPELTEEEMNELAEWFMGGLAHMNWGWLNRQSFIHQDEGGRVLMHKLMGAALQQMEKQERPDVFKRVHRRLLEKYDSLAAVTSPGEITQREEMAFKRAIIHALNSDFGYFTNRFWSHADMYHVAARHIFLIGVFVELSKYFKPLLKEQNQVALVFYGMFSAAGGVQLGALGFYREAEEILRSAWEFQRRPEVFGEENPETLTTHANLAHTIGEQGRHQEAEEELRAIWEIQRRPDVLGEEHPSTLVTRASLAQEIDSQGRYQQAEEELRAIWEIQRRPDVLGEENPTTLVTRASLANTIGEQGRSQQAEKEFRAIWEIQRRREVLGEDHPSTLATRHNFALQIRNQGRYQEAEKEFRAIWEIQRRRDVLGEDHPNTLATRRRLAWLVGNQGHYREAEREFRAIWEIQRRPDVLGEEHPSTLATRHDFALQISNQGRYQEAEGELRATWEIQRRLDVLGEEHPSTLVTRHNFALQISNQGRYQEAEGELRATWEIQRRPDVLGAKHPNTLATRHNLAVQFGHQGRHQEAEEEFRRIFEIQRRPDILGEEHPDTLATQFELAKVLDNQKRVDEADVLLEGLEEKLLKQLREEHNLVSEVREYLHSRLRNETKSD